MASYRAFTNLKAAGTIPPHVKLQVNLPIPKALDAEWIKLEYQAIIEPQYEVALIRELQDIQEVIPHQELAIQIDCHLASLELRASSPAGESSDAPDITWLADCAARLANQVGTDVDMGFHITGGTLSTIIDMALALSMLCPRPITWLHLPLPSNPEDEACFTALQRLIPRIVATATELVLGVVQPHDEEGSRRRLRLAADCLGSSSFGIAASCNFTDLSQEQFQDVLRVLRLLS